MKNATTWRGLQHFLADTVIFLYKICGISGFNVFWKYETYRSQFSFLTYNLNYSNRWEDKIVPNVDYTIQLQSGYWILTWWSKPTETSNIEKKTYSVRYVWNTITICCELIRSYFGYRWAIPSLTYWNKDRPTTIIKLKIYSKSINHIYWCEL